MPVEHDDCLKKIRLGHHDADIAIVEQFLQDDVVAKGEIHAARFIEIDKLAGHVNVFQPISAKDWKDHPRVEKTP